MTIRLLSLSLCSALGLAACQSAHAPPGSTAPEPRRIEIATPPEYVRCRDLERDLALSDAKVRGFSSRDGSTEATYWRDRNKRLIARAYECRRPS